MTRKIIYIVFMAVAMMATARDLSDETVKYKVMYKWGLVNKQAGTVNITLNNQADRYHAQLTAASASWADKLYKVRDTLECEMLKPDLRPVYYDKHSHEGGEDKHDHVAYEYTGKQVIGHCTRLASKKGKVVADETRTLTAEGKTIDMLTAYYYMRELPYQDWVPGHKDVVTIYSGKRKETLTITYHGIQTVKYDKQQYECYYITFTFTSDGKTKTSDDMMAWITTDDRRLPVKLEGKLPVGSVRCFMI